MTRNSVVKFFVDDAGVPVPESEQCWHLVWSESTGDKQAFCTNEYFGYGQGGIEKAGDHYKTKRGRITCEKCRANIKILKKVDLR